MSTIWVIDSSFRRTQSKVTPGKYLREVLEEACKSRKLPTDSYTLKTASNKSVDLSQPFRLSGLSAGAKLQLVQASKSPGVVSVALQLPDSEGGRRLNDKFPSTTSLWLVLRKYEDASPGKKLNLTQRGVPSGGSGSGRLNYEQPCLHLMGRNLETFEELQKTFAQLGLNGGSVLVRVSFKGTEKPLEEAMGEISGFFKVDGGEVVKDGDVGSSQLEGSAEKEVGVDDAHTQSILDIPAETAQLGEEAIPATTQDTSEDTTMVDDQPPNPTTSDTMPTTTVTSSTATTSSSSSHPHISVYHPPSSSTPAAALAPDDPTAFTPTIDHAKSHQANLLSAGRPVRLPSDAELAEKEAARTAALSTISTVAIRIRYPDQSQIETTISSTDTAADLYARVLDTLASAPEPIELRATGAKGHEVLPNSPTKRLIRDLGFRGRVLVTMVWGDGASQSARAGPSLKAELRGRATELKVELAGVRKDGEEAHKVAMDKAKAKEKAGGGGGGDVEAKLKKFLGFGKK